MEKIYIRIKRQFFIFIIYLLIATLPATNEQIGALAFISIMPIGFLIHGIILAIKMHFGTYSDSENKWNYIDFLIYFSIILVFFLIAEIYLDFVYYLIKLFKA